MAISINKETKNRISSWLADSEDPSLLKESRFIRNIEDDTYREATDEEIEVMLKEESFSILAEINEAIMGEDE